MQTSNMPTTSSPSDMMVEVDIGETTSTTSTSGSSRTTEGSQEKGEMVTTTKKVKMNFSFTQQTLPAFRFIFKVHYAMFIMFGLSLIFIGFGIPLLISTLHVQEYEIVYSGADRSCEMTRRADMGGAPFCESYAVQTVNVTKRMDPPVFVFYKLKNFYQNHRRYAESRNDGQLRGQIKTSFDSVSDCSPIRVYGSNHDKNAPIIDPCGLIAWSKFNDSFTLYKVDGSSEQVICDTTTLEGCTNKDITVVGSSKKFKRPEDIEKAREVNRLNPNTYYNESSHIIPDIEDVDLQNWMRLAPFPNFRKLFRVIRTPVEPGLYRLYAVQRFPIGERDNEITKSMVFSTGNWMGGKNYFLAISYIAAGGITLFLSFCLLIVSIVVSVSKRRKQKDST